MFALTIKLGCRTLHTIHTINSGVEYISKILTKEIREIKIKILSTIRMESGEEGMGGCSFLKNRGAASVDLREDKGNIGNKNITLDFGDTRKSFITLSFLSLRPSRRRR